MEPKRLLWVGRASGFPVQAPRPLDWGIDCLPPRAAVEQLRSACYDAVVLDLPFPDWSSESLLLEVQRAAPRTPVMLRDPQATPSETARLARLGISQFLPREGDALVMIEQLIESQRTESLARLAQRTAGEDWRRFLIGDSKPMRDVCHIIRMVGSRRATVLITGETGAGKEMAARALHMAGPRGRGPFVGVNCSAIPENLLEDELFGHVRGAFTGAIQSRSGRFEQAQGGVLFLDEIGELPMELQAKLLRVLQEREFQRLGSSETVRADVRVVAAANCDLAERIVQRRFREDLYYRLNVVPIHMPPLRERREDIPELAVHFVEKVCRAEELPLKALSDEAMGRLCACEWPGNVRQLENSVEMAVALSGERSLLVAADFRGPMNLQGQGRGAPESPVIPIPDSGLNYQRTLAGIERGILEQALQKTGGNKKAAAEMLGLKRTTLSAKVRSLETVAACN